MFFIDYERFYGSAAALKPTGQIYRKSTSAQVSVEDILDETQSEEVKKSRSFANLKSGIGALAAGTAAFIKSEETANKLNAAKGIIKSSAVGIGEKLSSIQIPKQAHIQEPVIEIPDEQRQNSDIIIDKYIEAAGYQPPWKFEKYCIEKLDFHSDNIASKYRIKVFTLYMKDFLAVISKTYKLDYLKIYEALPDYQNFFINESECLDNGLLVKASSQIIKVLVERGVLTKNGEGMETVFINNTITPSPEDIREETEVSPQTEAEQQEESVVPHEEILVRENEFQKPVREEPVQTVPVRQPIRQSASRNESAPIFRDTEPSYAQITPVLQLEEKNYTAIRIRNFIIILIIAIILTVALSWGIVNLFYYYQDKHSVDLPAEIASETTETTTVSTTAEVTDTTTTAAITTETIFTESVMPESKIETISISNLSSYPQYVEILRDYNSDERCMLCDLNNDSIAELVITNANNSILMIYTIYAGEAVFLIDATGNMSRGASICENGIIIQGFSGGASMSGVEYKRYNGGSHLDTVEYILHDESGIHHCVGENTIDITQAKSEEIQSKYKAMYLDTVPVSSLGFADDVKGDYLGIGYVHVDSGGLNLRSKPSTDSKVYTTIPNKASVTVYSSSTTGWYYAEYGTYKGYVSSEFISFTPDKINLSYIPDYVEHGMTVADVLRITGLTKNDFNITSEETLDIYGNKTYKTSYFLTYSDFKIPDVDMPYMPAVLFFEFTDSGVLYNYGYHIGTNDMYTYLYSLSELKTQYIKICDYLKGIYGKGEPIYYDDLVDSSYQWMLNDYKNIWIVVGENMWGRIGLNEITLSCSDPSLL